MSNCNNNTNIGDTVKLVSGIKRDAGLLHEVVHSNKNDMMVDTGPRKTLKGLTEYLKQVIAENGYKPPVDYGAGLNVIEPHFTVIHDGIVYAPRPDLLPFDTAEPFNPDQWLTLQGLTSIRLGMEDGANLVGYHDKTVGSAIDGLSYSASTGLSCSRRIIAELPLSFPDHDEAKIVAESSTYLYPQGMSFDDDGRLFIKYQNGKKSVLAVYSREFKYIGWFALEHQGGESVVVYDGYIFNRNGNSIYRYKIPENLSGSVVPGSPTGVSGAGTVYGFDGETWIMEQSSPDLSNKGSRTSFNLYDRNFKKIGNYYVSKNLVGEMLASDGPLYRLIPKIQGITISNGFVYIGVGASYIPSIESYSRNANIGVIKTNMRGDVLDYGLLDGRKLMEELRSLGHTVSRIESEGITNHNGRLYTLNITETMGQPNVKSGGILITEEFCLGGDDFSRCKTGDLNYFDDSRLWQGLYPRNQNGYLENPFTFEKFKSMDDVLSFMGDYQLPAFRYFSTAVDLEPIQGMTVPSSAYVEITIIRPSLFFIYISSEGFSGNYTAFVEDGEWKASKQHKHSPNAIEFTGNSPWRITSPSNGGGASLGVQMSATSSSNLVDVGGGSSLYKAATAVRFFTARNISEPSGVNACTVTTNSTGSPTVRGGSDSQTDLGTGGVRFDNIYLANNPTVTSDAREKQQIDYNLDPELRAWSRVSFCKFRLNSAVKLKGDGARIHFGVIAQDVKAAFEAEGLDPFLYGILCYDEWGDEYGAEGDPTTMELDHNENNHNGSVGEGAVLIRREGNRYGIRYDQALILECALMRKRMK